jgi:hypothetical protein
MSDFIMQSTRRSQLAAKLALAAIHTNRNDIACATNPRLMFTLTKELPEMLTRGIVIGVLALPLLAGSVAAQDASPPCIGQHTLQGLEFSGNGGSISEPFPVNAGALFATVQMSEAGAIKLMNAAGDTVLLGNAAEPYTTTEAVTVYTAGDYYLVADFYSADGTWSAIIEQPMA